MPFLKELKERATGRIKIMAGSGISATNALEIIKTTDVDEIHASCKSVIGRDENLRMEHILDVSNAEYTETDSQSVKSLLDVVKNFINMLYCKQLLNLT
jgi:copper homeostasis protein